MIHLLEYLVKNNTKPIIYKELFEPSKEQYIEYIQAWTNVFKDICLRNDSNALLPALKLYKVNAWAYEIYCDEDTVIEDISLNIVKKYVIDSIDDVYIEYINDVIVDIETNGVHSHILSMGSSGSILRSLFCQCDGADKVEDALIDGTYDTNNEKQYEQQIKSELENILSKI